MRRENTRFAVWRVARGLLEPEMERKRGHGGPLQAGGIEGVMISGITNAGAISVLERALQFAGQRHGLLAHNIANISTPDFRPKDVSVQSFQQHLGEAVDRRRASKGNAGGQLQLSDTAQVAFHRERMTLTPEPVGENILFHDGNDRNVERMMQGLVENFMAFRMASQFIRREFDTLNMAIRERL